MELAQLQDQEVGDGTTSVVIVAAELLKNADELVKQKIHPTSIISGYRLACKEVSTFWIPMFTLDLWCTFFLFKLNRSLDTVVCVLLF